MARNSKNKLSFLVKNPLLLIGLLLLSLFFAWRYYRVRVLSFNVDKIDKTDQSVIIPRHIKIYPIGVDVDIKTSTISNGVWMTDKNMANYLIESSGISGGGNIIVYGHNKDTVLGPIRWIKEGNTIEMTGDNNLTYLFKVVKTDIVYPDNLSYIQKTSEETLTIYTCTGIFDSKRFVVVAKPVKEESNTLKPSQTTKPQLSTPSALLKATLSPTNQKKEFVYVTYYGFDDNDPPGRDIAYPKSSYPKSVHEFASGVGTFDDPVTVATSPGYLPIGSKVYIPYIKKYGVVEDYCQTCDINFKNGGKKHIDVWAGGDGTNTKKLVECEEFYTRESEQIIINPTSGFVVNFASVCF